MPAAMGERGRVRSSVVAHLLGEGVAGALLHHEEGLAGGRLAEGEDLDGAQEPRAASSATRRVRTERDVQRRVEREQREQRRRALRLVHEPLHRHAADDREQGPAQPPAGARFSPRVDDTDASRCPCSIRLLRQGLITSTRQPGLL